MSAAHGIGIANLPNQVRPSPRRSTELTPRSGIRLVRPGAAGLWTELTDAVAKRGGHFTLMVVGESGLGKTTLMWVPRGARHC